jgi:hypothetical protein
MVLKSLTLYLGFDQKKKKEGRPPKVSDLQFSG